MSYERIHKKVSKYQPNKKVRQTSETMNGFCSVMSVIGHSRLQIGKEDDEKDKAYCNAKSYVNHTFTVDTIFTSCCGTGTTT
jgi:hypothetical protein